MTISVGYILYCVCFNLYCGGFILFCNACVCVDFVMCGCFGKKYIYVYICIYICVYIYIYIYIYIYTQQSDWDFFLTLAGVFPSIFFSFKTNARVKLANTGHGPHSSTLVVVCVVLLLFVLFCVLFCV